MKLLKYVVFLIILYLFVFNPVFGPFTGIFSLVNIFVLLGIVGYIMKPEVISYYIRANRDIFFLIIYLLFFALIRNGMEGATSVMTQHLLGMLRLFFVVPFIIYYHDKLRLGDNLNMIKCFIIIGVVGSLITLLCIVNPGFHEYLTTSVMQYSKEQQNVWFYGIRGFGFAQLLTSDYGYLMGIFFGLGCFCYNKKIWFWLCSPLLLMAVMANARLGMVIALLAIVFFLSTNKNVALSIVVFTIGTVFLLNIEGFMAAFSFSEQTVSWLSAGYEEAQDAIVTGGKSNTGTLSTLFHTMWILPDSKIQWFLGRGFDVFYGGHGVHNSDVGWLRELNFGGLMYFIPYLILLGKIFMRFYKTFDRGFSLFFISTIIIINTKTIVFPLGHSFYVLMTCYFLMIAPHNYQIKQYKVRR